MPLFEKPFSLQIPVRIGKMNFSFFINENIYTVSSEANSVPHNHHDYELRYIATGSCTQFINGIRTNANSGKCLITHPFEYHWQAWNPGEEDSTQYNLRFSLKTPDPSSKKSYLSCQKFLSIMDQLRVVDVEPDRFTTLFRFLTEEIYRKESGFVQEIQSLCQQIIIELLRYAEKGSSENEKRFGFFAHEKVRYSNFERTQIDQFFRERFLEDIGASELAKELNVSVRQVNNLMHRFYNMSFIKKRTEMRLQLSLPQLESSEKSIGEIAHDCSFQNQNYFFKCFRDLFGVTPTEYRKKHRSGSQTNS